MLVSFLAIAVGRTMNIILQPWHLLVLILAGWFKLQLRPWRCYALGC